MSDATKSPSAGLEDLIDKMPSASLLKAVVACVMFTALAQWARTYGLELCDAAEDRAEDRAEQDRLGTHGQEEEQAA